MEDGENEPVEVPRQVYCELKTMRQMGTHEPLSDEVLDGLETYNFRAAREWVLDNPEAYVRTVYDGMVDATSSESES
ncbi:MULTISPECIES: hypothetical protein [Halorussus]|uniref:hypothetical protein n=1 Tax=Halorussus TaxID=1070314 RepID=UPI0020A048D4|nr:hypothetical protein [Halorussus vallis]USZ76088.1 hypothetical protein NGM07_01895 [Halorussus vallis]